MSVNVNIILNKNNKIYYEGDVITGVVLIDSKAEGKHDGVVISLEGVLNVHMSLKTSGLLQSFVQADKPVVLISVNEEIAKPGKLSAGRTELPFSIPLVLKGKKILYETFHGVHIIIQYILKCELKRSLLAKDILKTQEILVHSKNGGGCRSKLSRKEFIINPESLKNVRERARIPKFLVRGHLVSNDLPLSHPITGQLQVEECERGISSIELQLVRVETCGSSEVNTREVSEIQNIQLCCGDVPRGIAIPIYMILPRLFTCATVVAPTFKIEFEVNVIIIFDNDYLVMESFPLRLTRD